MTTPEEYEAEIDRLSAALDLEVKARKAAADWVVDLREEVRRAEARLKIVTELYLDTLLRGRLTPASSSVSRNYSGELAAQPGRGEA